MLWDSINLAYTRQLVVYSGVGAATQKHEITNFGSGRIELNNDSFQNQSNWFLLELIDKCRDVHPSDTHKTVHLSVNKSNKIATELNWNPYKGWEYVSYYAIYRAAENGAFRYLATVPGWQTSYTDSSFCDSAYRYKVAAIDGITSNPSYSNSLLHQTEYIYQNVPLEILVTTVNDNKEIKTHWHKSKQIGSLEYQVSKQEQLSGKTKVWKTTSDTFIIDEKVLINDFHYTYQIKVADKCGNLGGKSNIGRSILLDVDQVDKNTVLTWNQYQHWQNGVKEYIVEVQPPGAKGFSELGRVTDTTISDPVAFANYETAFKYRVKAVENGLLPDTSYSNERLVIPVPSIFAANAFSPNGDGINDEFSIYGWALLQDLEDVEEFSLKIYNRWGERVFESHDITDGWDGTFKGIDCQLDQYIWHAKVTALNGNIYFLNGGVLLTR